MEYEDERVSYQSYQKGELCLVVVRNAKRKVNDIVYFVKDTKVNEELRYSLRSLKNFPHAKVWFYGGCPKGLEPDRHIFVDQDQPTKWENIFKMFKMVCYNNEISDNFWLFNDDFFIMKPVKDGPNYYEGNLYKRVVTLEDTHKGITPYSQQLRYTLMDLESMGCSTINYAVHTPILINREKGRELCNIINGPMIRCVYGNYFKIGGTNHRDVKIDSIYKEYKNEDYLSTNDKSFKGIVGEQIKKRFAKPCQYEKTPCQPTCKMFSLK